jgi:hypothetical protein
MNALLKKTYLIDYSNCTIAMFMDAAFNDARDVLSDEDLANINNQYLDESGLYLNTDFELVASINFLQNRINCINLGLQIHRQCLKLCGVPVVDRLDYFTKWGHYLTWRDDIANFEKQLNNIETKEKRFISQINAKKKQLEDFRKIQPKQDTKQSRINFLRMLVSLQKLNYKIDKHSTTMEDLAIMIKDNKELHDGAKYN